MRSEGHPHTVLYSGSRVFEVKIDPRFREWDQKGSLVSFVVSLNLHRRHLTPSQIAIVSVTKLEFKEKEAKERQKIHGRTAPGKIKNTEGNISLTDSGKATEKLGKEIGVNPRYIQDAKKIVKEAPELEVIIEEHKPLTEADLFED